jgi:hypothetical protein
VATAFDFIEVYVETDFCAALRFDNET